jgi:mercuric ion transport protein
MLAVLGVAGGAGTLLASSCCILPLALGGFGASGALVVLLESLTPWRMPLFALSAVAIAGGWAMWWRYRRDACTTATGCAVPRNSVAAVTMLAVATKFLAVAALWILFEPAILSMLQGG